MVVCSFLVQTGYDHDLTGQAPSDGLSRLRGCGHPREPAAATPHAAAIMVPGTAQPCPPQAALGGAWTAPGPPGMLPRCASLLPPLRAGAAWTFAPVPPAAQVRAAAARAAN